MKKKDEIKLVPSSAEVKEYIDLVPDNSIVAKNYKTKLSPEFVKTLSLLLDSNEKAAWLTEEQLIKLVNYRLPKEKQIAMRTYKEWKQKVANGQVMHNDQFKMFSELVELIEIKKELALVGKLEDGCKNYLSVQWLLERSPKFRAKYGKSEGMGVNIKGDKNKTQINFNF